MTPRTSRRLGFVVLAGACLAAFAGQAARAADDAPLAHMVFFTLADPSPASHDALVAGCQKYLTGHDGLLYFSVGTRGKEFARDVNDQEFDVALHMVFKDKAAHDTYQTHPRHNEFIEKNKALWAKVRVFDSYLAPAPTR